MPTFFHEQQHAGLVAGIDEAGRGPWAGPVVAAAVILPINFDATGIDDSKKIKPKMREILFEKIMSQAHVGIGQASAQEIDQLNILAATMLAMQRAYENLPQKASLALIDGNKAPKLPCPTQTLIGGDAISVSIAAASIIAKVTRDRIMAKLANEFPYYGWEKNSGYGTAKHQEGLAKFGITPHHRRSYKPIKLFINHVA